MIVCAAVGTVVVADEECGGVVATLSNAATSTSERSNSNSSSILCLCFVAVFLVVMRCWWCPR